MADPLVLVASLAYLVSTLVFGAYLLRFDERFAKAGVLALTAGCILNVFAVVVRVADGSFSMGVFDLLLIACALFVGAWLIRRLKTKRSLFGAFLTPVATMVLYSLHVYQKEGTGGASTEVAFVTPIHKFGSYIGFLIFAVAGAAAVMEIVQEYRLKTKQLKLVQQGRLPSLRRLEQISHRALIIGFPIYSVGMALGAVWLAHGGNPVTRHFIMATFSWILYAATLHARVVVGLKGRRAAILTLAAFVSALFVVLLAVLRGGG